MRRVQEDSYKTESRALGAVKLIPSRSHDMRSHSYDGGSPGETMKQREPHSYNVTPGVLTSIVKHVRKTGQIQGREELADLLRRSMELNSA